MGDTPPNEPNLTGIPKEFPKAAGMLATLGTTLVTEGSNLARYMGKIVGMVPEDAVGILLGDPLHAVRTLAAGW
jgi:hypothetical protein